jgi:hypothetical protein
MGASYREMTEPGFTALVSGIYDAHSDLFFGPILQFYDIETSDGTHYRVVDWGDVEAGAAEGTVDFDSETWTTVFVIRPQVTSGTDGALPSARIVIADPDRVILAWIRSNDNLRDAQVTMRVIAYADLSTPSVADSFVFRLRKAVSVENPAAVRFEIGSPSIFDIQCPFLDYNRAGCNNPFEKRFNHGLITRCTYPSDEFEAQTEQLFVQDDDAVHEVEHGWTVDNGNTEVNGFDSNQDDGSSSADKCLSIDTNTQRRWWSNGAGTTYYEAPHIYKIIEDSTESSIEIDVHCKLDVIFSGETYAFAGIFVQCVDDPTYYYGWGRYIDNVTVSYLRFRGLNDVFAISKAASTVNAFRVAYASATTVKLYHRTEDDTVRTFDETTWTLMETLTLTGWPGGHLRVGLMACNPNTTAIDKDYEALFYHFRFLAGGFTTCDRTLIDCTERKNTVQRNGYLGLPDRVTHF